MLSDAGVAEDCREVNLDVGVSFGGDVGEGLDVSSPGKGDVVGDGDDFDVGAAAVVLIITGFVMNEAPREGCASVDTVVVFVVGA